MAIVFEEEAEAAESEFAEKLANELDLLARVSVVTLADADEKLLERLVRLTRAAPGEREESERKRCKERSQGRATTKPWRRLRRTGRA